MTSEGPSRHDVLLRIRSEYLEMPGLRLTSAQAGRLWGLEPRECEHLLTALVLTGFLRRSREGAYVRADASSS